jgi:phosphopantothenoylcysteine decarboxylase / phosphopantothenate---cysteine ligase
MRQKIREKRAWRFLITAGPTREAIDPVRFLSNRSSGKMGYALATAASQLGKVTLISGPVSLAKPRGVKIIQVESAAQMASAVFRVAPKADVIIQCAAVADYRPARSAKHKIKKSGRSLSLRLMPATDILAELGRKKKAGQILIGFAAETRQLRKNALSKLRRKKLDFIVANPVGKKGAGFDSDRNEAILFGRKGFEKKFPRQSKSKLAVKLIRLFLLQSKILNPKSKIE